jgi:hypothetical protein
MDALTKQLEASIALRHAADALQKALPLLKEEQEDMSNAAVHALAKGRKPWVVQMLEERSSKLLEAIMCSEIALKDAAALVPVKHQPTNLRVMGAAR